MPRSVFGRLTPLPAALALLALWSAPARTASRVLIWPLNPQIEANQTAAPLWLENQGTTPLTLQIRVLGWVPQGYDERYDDAQKDVVASPPIAAIDPGRRQLVRLVRMTPMPPGRQGAYRVVIDELPDVTGTEWRIAPQPVLGVTFRLRYSLPLFTFGEGLTAADARDPDLAGRIAWRLVDEGGQRWLQLRNRARVHARVSRVRLVGMDGAAELASGLLGYVLPGAERRWPVPSDLTLPNAATLVADLNGRPDLRLDAY